MATYIRTKPEPYCPECGAKMALRRPKPSQDFEPFWGCSQYPDCRGTRRVVEVNEDQLPMFPDPDSESEDTMATPSIGRVVHYVNEAGAHQAAIIVKVWSNECVNLHVLPDYSDTHEAVGKTSVLYHDEGPDSPAHPYSWHWCEYVPDGPKA